LDIVINAVEGITTNHLDLSCAKFKGTSSPPIKRN